jgi:hypothetical protein
MRQLAEVGMGFSGFCQIAHIRPQTSTIRHLIDLCDYKINVDCLNYFDDECIKIVNKRNLFLGLCIAIELYNEEKENNDLYTLNIINLIFYKL